MIRHAIQSEQKEHVLAPLVVTGPDKKTFVWKSDDLKPAFRVGEYVFVERDMSPGKNRQSGYGFVHEVNGYGGATICSVKGDFRPSCKERLGITRPMMMRESL